MGGKGISASVQGDHLGCGSHLSRTKLCKVGIGESGRLRSDKARSEGRHEHGQTHGAQTNPPDPSVRVLCIPKLTGAFSCCVISMFTSALVWLQFYSLTSSVSPRLSHSSRLCYSNSFNLSYGGRCPFLITGAA